MCDPFSVGAAALSAAGIGANMLGAGEQQSARDSAMAAEGLRQQGIQQKSTDLFNVTLDKATAPKQMQAQTDAAKVRTGKDVATLEANSGVYGTAGASLDSESKSSIARALRGALDRGKQQAKLNGDVNGVGDATARLGVDLNRAGQWQSIFGGNARSSAALLPLELEEANRAGSTMRGIGQILGAGGQALGTAGVMGGGPSWGELFGSSGRGFTPAFGGATNGAGPGLI